MPAIALQLDVIPFASSQYGQNNTSCPRGAIQLTAVVCALLRVSRHVGLRIHLQNILLPCRMLGCVRGMPRLSLNGCSRNRCAACFRLVSVSFAPLNIRAISCVRSDVVHPPDLGLGPPALLRLLNQKMLIRKRRNLRQMGDAQHLLPLGQRLQLSPHRLRRPPADADIDLVEDQRPRQNGLLLSPRPPDAPPPPSPSAPASRATSRRPRRSRAAASTARRRSWQSDTPPGPSHAPSSSSGDFSAVTWTLKRVSSQDR